MHGYQEITRHIIFYVNMNFTRNAIYVSNGSKAEAPVAFTNSRVVSRDISRLELFISSLNDLDVMAYDIVICIYQCTMQR